MIGKFLVRVLPFLTTVACAQPKYEIAREGVVQTKESCQTTFKNSGLCLFWTWQTLPTARTQGSLNFQIYKSDLGLAFDPPTLPEVVLWMPSMGHGSSPTQTRRTAPGAFEVTNVFFVMPGEWEIRFQFRDSNGVVDEAIVPITL